MFSSLASSYMKENQIWKPISKREIINAKYPNEGVTRGELEVLWGGPLMALSRSNKNRPEVKIVSMGERSKTILSNDGDKNPKSSVIIPTYYRPHELSCLFDSLLEQNAKPGEVIVVDDTPNTEINSLCEKYADKFSRIGVTLAYVKNPRERSVSIARNLGGKMAHGDILLFIDSDVILHPNYIEKVLSTFKKHPQALGVAGWEKVLIDSQFPEGVLYQSIEILRKLFFLSHFSRNSCNNFEYPLELENTIYSKYLNGRCSSVKKLVFNEFRFDENLKGYSWMEDFLFSASIYKKYPQSLLISPEAMYTHINNSETVRTRPKGKNLVEIKRRNRKYVLMQLWGSEGLLIFGWQNMGILVFRCIAEFRRSVLRRGNENNGLTGGEE